MVEGQTNYLTLQVSLVILSALWPPVPIYTQRKVDTEYRDRLCEEERAQRRHIEAGRRGVCVTKRLAYVYLSVLKNGVA